MKCVLRPLRVLHHYRQVLVGSVRPRVLLGLTPATQFGITLQSVVFPRLATTKVLLITI